jgi:hypothetical protein
MGSLSRNESRDSDAWRSMVWLKRRLVLQLVAGQGRFSELVHEVRRLRGIVPKTQVPPPDWLRRVRGPQEPQTMPYPHDVYRIRDEVIPEAYYRGFTFDWLGFIAACLFYQPPRGEELEEFAAFGSGPYPYTFIAPGLSAAQSPRMVAPPIREVRGDDGRVRYEISVDEHTTEADVRRAYWKIASIRKKPSKGGAPKRDPFVAVQCAILYDEANLPDEADGRRWRWTYEKLADRFGLKSGRAAKDHIELGRAILQKKVALQ